MCFKKAFKAFCKSGAANCKLLPFDKGNKKLFVKETVSYKRLVLDKIKVLMNFQ